MNRKRETRQEREHRFDRMVNAATYRREQARKGRGYRFEIPAKARR